MKFSLEVSTDAQVDIKAEIEEFIRNALDLYIFNTTDSRKYSISFTVEEAI